MVTVLSHPDVGSPIDFLNVWLCAGRSLVDGRGRNQYSLKRMELVPD